MEVKGSPQSGQSTDVESADGLGDCFGVDLEGLAVVGIGFEVVGILSLESASMGGNICCCGGDRVSFLFVVCVVWYCER